MASTTSQRIHMSGFTLIEAMITLAIIAILMVMTTNMQVVFQKGQHSSYVRDFVSELNMTRSEAINRNTRVTICKRDTDNPNKCTTKGRWDNGWIVFVDSDANAQVENPATEIIKVHGPLKGQFDLVGVTTKDINDYISFIATGYPRTKSDGMQFGSFLLCDHRGYDSARKIVIANTGHIKVKSTADHTGGVTSCPS